MRIVSCLSLTLLLSCVAREAPRDEIALPPVHARTLTLSAEDFIVIGDQGTGPGTDHQYQVASSIAQYCERTQQCDAGLTVGDNFYPDGVSSGKDPKWRTHFEEPYKKLNFTFYPALGNHDYLMSGDWQSQVAYRSPRWHMPYRYYKLASVYADIICIDSEYLDDEQLSFVDSQLKASRTPWQVVYLHRPIYSSGEHGDTSILKRALLPILERNGVDLVIAGHDHNLELQLRAGMLHAVSGSAGKSRSLRNGAYTLFGRDAPGFLAIDFEESVMHLRFVGLGGQTLYTRTVSANALMEDQ